MRFATFFALSAIAFIVIFWLTWDYRTIASISTAKNGDSQIVSVQFLAKTSLFSTFESETEFLHYDAKGNQFSKIEFYAVEVKAIFASGNSFWIVYPDSICQYQYANEKLAPVGKLVFFGDIPNSTGRFLCDTCAQIGEKIVLFGTTKRDSKTAIYKLLIRNGEVNPPVEVQLLDYTPVNLSCIADEDRVLLIWSDSTKPHHIAYRVFDSDEEYGGARTIAWNSPYAPAFHKGDIGLFIKSDKELSFNFHSFAGEVVENAVRLDNYNGSIRAAAFDGKNGFVSDGANLYPAIADEDGHIRVIDSPIILGKASLNPQTVVFIAQIIMIVLLLAFSFTLVRRTPIRSSRAVVLPSNIILRFSALVVDSLITAPLAILLFIAYLYYSDAPFVFHLWSTHELSVFQFIASSCLIVYGAALEFTMGRTIGKMVFGLFVINSFARRPRFAPVFVRNLMKPVDFALAFLFITPLIMIITPFNQRLGDLLSQTVVVQGKPNPTGETMPVEFPDSETNEEEKHDA